MDKMKVLGYVSIFTPPPIGILAGYFLYNDKKYKKTGINVLILSLLWPIILGVLGKYLIDLGIIRIAIP